MTSALSQAGTELIAIRADNAALRKELATKDARIAEQASAALGMAAVNEMLRKELAEANAVIHTTQDGSLARDLLGVIQRAEAERKTLREALEYYACPEDCRRERLKDGTCIMAVSGECGETARAALAD